MKEDDIDEHESGIIFETYEIEGCGEGDCECEEEECASGCGGCHMSRWDNFYGCARLTIDKTVNFLLYLESSERIKTEDGKFLHYQYLRDLLDRKGIVNGRLYVDEGNYTYFTIDNMKKEIDRVMKLHGMVRMLIPKYEACIKTLETMYTEDWYSLTIMSDAIEKLSDEDITIEGSIEPIMSDMIKYYFELLITDDYISDMELDDLFIKKSGKTEYLKTHELFTGWYHGKYRLDNIYLYQMDVKSFSMKFDWKGFNTDTNQLETGTTKLNDMGWLNI